jgi:hypothetical protein
MNAKAEIAAREEPSNSHQAAPQSMLALAIERGMSPEIIGQLITHQERIDANRARKAFVEARAAAKAKLADAPILKNRVGNNKTRYADFSAYAAVVDPILAEFGLSYGFETEQAERITVTCVLSHADGHEARNSLSGAPDKTGNKNDIQAIGSTLTYQQRYTLTAALGLSASDDDDGKAAGGNLVSEEQVEALRVKIVDTGADLTRFLRYFKIEKIEDLPATQFDRATAMLAQKERT